MKFFAIVPAAGLSRRMGQPKLVMPWKSNSIIQHTLAAWHESRVDRVIVVVRPDDTELQQHLDGSAVDLVVPSVDPPEMKDSVLLGIKYIQTHFGPGVNDAMLLAPADMPELNSVVIDKVIEAHDPERAAIIAPIHLGKKGHPVLFPWPFTTGAYQLHENQGLNELWKIYHNRTIEVSDTGSFLDVDTPDDFCNKQ